MSKQTFTVGQVLTAAQMTSLQQTALGGGSTTAKTASYTLVAADAGTVVQMNSASATTITVNTALFAAGDTVQIQNVGVGVCTVTAGSATVNTAGSLALSQYEGGQLYFNTTSAALFFDIVQSSGMTNPMTTTGDIIYSSSGSTPARLGIGTTGQVLNVASGLPAWATPAAATSGYTFISRSTFSAVATADIDSIFTSTYETYQVVIETCFSSTDSQLSMQLRYGSTTQTTGYYGVIRRFNGTYTSDGGTNISNGANFLINDQIRTSTGQASNSTFTINQVGNGSRNPILYGIGNSCSYIVPTICNGYMATAQAFTGIRLAAVTGNLTAQVSVYGLAKA